LKYLSLEPQALRVWKNEVLAGITVSFAMVPEVIAFAFVCGVNPLVGLYAAFVAGLVTAVVGGRPGMISGGAGSLAVVSVYLVASHGVEFLFAAITLMGLIQLLIGLFGWGKFIQLVPHPVMLGFVNGLATVIFLAQLRQFTQNGHLLPTHEVLVMASLVVATILITTIMPRVTKVVPSSLVAIALTTLAVQLFHLRTRTVGSLAQIHGAFPPFHIPRVPLTFESLWIVLPYAVVLAGVGLTESLLTQNLIDDLTNTQSSNNRECIGQGLSNIATGLFGGMGGCAMIGQSILNIEAGGRHRLSGVIESLSILCFILFASPLISAVPMGALVGVMCVVVFKTFSWSSLKILHKVPKADAAVIVLVTAVTVFTNLAVAVLVGVIVSALRFAWSMAQSLDARREVSGSGEVVYEVHGPLFFGSVQTFSKIFRPQDDPERVVVDFRFSRVSDHSAIEALKTVRSRYVTLGKEFELRHLSPESLEIIGKAGELTNLPMVPGENRHVATRRLTMELDQSELTSCES